MSILLWIGILLAALALLVKSADWFVESAEKIGVALKISPFIIGVVVVAIGTSFPELVAAIAATMKGASDFVSANVIGSNIANILLIIGISSIIGRRLIVKRSLIDLDAPLLACVTGLFVFMAWDKVITMGEGILLLLSFLVYLGYTIFQERASIDVLPSSTVEILPDRSKRRSRKALKEKKKEGRQKITLKTTIFLILGALGLAVGANYTIDAVIKIAEILVIAPTLIAITAVAIGTSLPELMVSIQSARKKKYEIALGNVFGSNVFNILLVAGIPSLFGDLPVDSVSFSVGIPFLVLATLLFIFSGISKKIHLWEGMMFLCIYILFVAKLIGAF